jgi:lipopolysaccharide transport system ATP-binding protein
MNTIRQLCARCIVMDHGRIIFDGNTEEAISIYMNSTKKPNLINDCSQISRNKSIIDENIHVNKVTFIDTDTTEYYPGEKVRVKVEYSTKKAMHEIAFRMTIEAADKTIVGLATSKKCINARQGENEATLTLALDWLAPGKYIVKLTAYSVNEYGTNQMHDVVENAFAFEKRQDRDTNNSMVWNHTWWGFMMFPELQVD